MLVQTLSQFKLVQVCDSLNIWEPRTGTIDAAYSKPLQTSKILKEVDSKKFP